MHRAKNSCAETPTAYLWRTLRPMGRRISSHQCAQCTVSLETTFRRRKHHWEQSSSAANTNKNKAQTAEFYSAMYQQPYECCSHMDEIGLNVLIQFVGEYNEAINKYLNMQSNPGVSVCYFNFFFPLAEISSWTSPWWAASVNRPH